MAQRVEGPWVPTWEEVAGAATNLARQNLWRVSPLYDMDDLLQEARLKFLYLQRKYPRVVDPPHFMSLFYRSFVNHLHRLAASRGRSASGHVVHLPRSAEDRSEDQHDPIEALPDQSVNIGAEERFETRLEKADPAVQALVRGVNGPRPVRRRRKDTGARETTNTFLCRLARLDVPDPALRQKLSTFLDNAI